MTIEGARVHEVADELLRQIDLTRGSYRVAEFCGAPAVSIHVRKA